MWLLQERTCQQHKSESIKKGADGLASIRAGVPADEERKECFPQTRRLVHAQGHTHQNKHTIPPFSPLFFDANMLLQIAPNSHPAAGTMALNRKQRLFSTFPTDEERAACVCSRDRSNLSSQLKIQAPANQAAP